VLSEKREASVVAAAFVVQTASGSRLVFNTFFAGVHTWPDFSVNIPPLLSNQQLVLFKAPAN
jgi:hypothetical protein